MTFRVSVEPGSVIGAGVLDDSALVAALARCRACGAKRLVLRSGTHVRPECVPALAALELEVVAESPFLARWLAQARAEIERGGACAVAGQDGPAGGTP